MLYRFVDLDRIDNIVRDGYDCLVHPTLWRDPYEWRFLYANVLYPLYVYDGKMSTEPPPEGTKFYLSNFMQDNEYHGRAHFIYGQCWSSRDESAALWRTPKTYVRVAIDNIVLENQISRAVQGNRYYIRPVKYAVTADVTARRDNFIQEWRPTRGRNEPVDVWFDEIAALLNEKRQEFDFEHEVRVVMFAEKEHLSWRSALDRQANDAPLAEHDDMAKLYSYPIDINKHVSSILLHPDLNADEYHAQMQRLRQIGIIVPIAKSQLYNCKRLDTWGSKPHPGWSGIWR